MPETIWMRLERGRVYHAVVPGDVLRGWIRKYNPLCGAKPGLDGGTSQSGNRVKCSKCDDVLAVNAAKQDGVCA